MKEHYRYFQNVRIKTKLIVFSLILVIVISSIFIFINRNSHDNLSIFIKNHEIYYAINSLNLNLRNSDTILSNYLSEYNHSYFETYHQIKKTNYSLLIKIKEQAVTNEEKLLIRGISNLCDAYYENSFKVFEFVFSDEVEAYKYFYHGNKILNYVYQYTGQYLQEVLSNHNIKNIDFKIKMDQLERTSLVLLLIIIISCIIFTFIFSSYIANPINELIKMSTKMAEGDLSVEKLEIKSYNEIGQLINSFNHMSQSIRKLISDIESKNEVDEMLREAKFQALQAQINPHFLFNTLNIISRSVSFESIEITQKLIQSLAELFRYTLEYNKNHSTLKVELNIVEKYLYIQQFRFNDRLSTSFDIDPRCQQTLIPKLTLQPIIENSFIHGLEPTDRKGHIHIQTKITKNNVLIRIYDNGIGIDKNRIKEILAPDLVTHKGAKTSVGLLNVYNRLKFLNNGDLSIISKEGKWTLLTIKIPNEKA